MMPFLLAAVLVVVAGVLIGLGLAEARVRRRTARSRKLGRAGAQRALRLLERAGYRVVDTEVSAAGVLRVDGERIEFRVRADAIVRRWGRRYVAEFKGGAVAARIENRATRRQLLEYAAVFGTRRILLVDAAAGRIRRVEFGDGAFSG